MANNNNNNNNKFRVFFTFADCEDPDEHSLPQFTGRNPRLKSKNVHSCTTFHIHKNANEDHDIDDNDDIEVFAIFGRGAIQTCLVVHFDKHWTFKEGGTLEFRDQIYPIQHAVLYRSIQIEGNRCYDNVLGIQLPTNIFPATEQLVG